MSSLLPDKKTTVIERLSQLIPHIGVASRAALGTVLGGPYGAAAGAVLGILFQQNSALILEDIFSRQLSPNEGRRLASTVLGAAERIREKLALQHPLKPGWFKNTVDLSDEAAEVIEGVLIHAQREYEEKKLKHYAYLLANLAFASNISDATANMLVKLCNSLSYRQLGLIYIFNDSKRFLLRQTDRQTEDFTGEDINPVLEPLYMEIKELNNLMILMQPVFMMNFEDINPSSIVLMGTGKLLYSLMELNQYDQADLKHLIEELKI